ncbi:hypothetical protein Trco_007582 [Trichoderma cornu-damae]|uniref:Uncharacterized protein n=1 Tax=Trichoderma cornu-damae TaxID=654480 RepID=A0A9P8QEG9_9HYPO|nr:hypothetical protein Trco_007582 [Trichoderma cornu-damae]
MPVNVLEEAMAHAGRNIDDVSSFDDGLDAPRVVFTSKTELGTTSCDAEDLVGSTVEVRGVIHGVASVEG